MEYRPEHRTFAEPKPGLGSPSPFALRRPVRHDSPTGGEAQRGARKEDGEPLARRVETASRLGHDFARLPVSSGRPDPAPSALSPSAADPARSPFRTSTPIQRTARLRHFRSGRTKFASRSNGNIGSVYAQNSTGPHNRGYRIRLEHRGGPHLSRRRSYRHTQDDLGVRTLLAGDAIGGLGTGRLVETRSRRGRVRHRSRGALGDMTPLSNDQARALFDLAQASDADRANIGAGLTHADKASHAAVHNQRMRELLRGPLFTGHELGEGQARRDREEEAPAT